MKIEVLRHASIKLTGDKIIYFDPYQIKEELHDADYIFITHDHYDHYDEESIHNIQYLLHTVCHNMHHIQIE